MRSIGDRLAVFTIGMLIFTAAAAGVAFGIVGWPGVEGVLYSSVLCLVPGWLTVFVSDLMKHRDSSAYAVLVGTGLRMVFVFLGIFVVGALRPGLGFREFTGWLVVSYLVALALETWVILAPEAPVMPSANE